MVGGNAVAEWVGRIDEDAVRNTRDVDILIRRPDYPAARACLESVGFFTSGFSASIRLSTGRKASQAVESTFSTRAKRFDGTTSTRYPKSRNPNEPATFRWSISMRSCS